MTNARQDLMSALDEVEKLFSGPRVVGFTPLLRDLSAFATREQGYPPYNIIKDGDDRWYLEIACAGFSTSEVKVEVSEGLLSVKGHSNVVEKMSREYVYRGLARRDWEVSIRLGDHIVVEEPIMQHGMLTIPLQREIPEAKKPRVLEVREVPVQNDGPPVLSSVKVED